MDNIVNLNKLQKSIDDGDIFYSEYMQRNHGCGFCTIKSARIENNKKWTLQLNLFVMVRILRIYYDGWTKCDMPTPSHDLRPKSLDYSDFMLNYYNIIKVV